MDGNAILNKYMGQAEGKGKYYMGVKFLARHFSKAQASYPPLDFWCWMMPCQLNLVDTPSTVFSLHHFCMCCYLNRPRKQHHSFSHPWQYAIWWVQYEKILHPVPTGNYNRNKKTHARTSHSPWNSKHNCHLQDSAPAIYMPHSETCVQYTCINGQEEACCTEGCHA